MFSSNRIFSVIATALGLVALLAMATVADPPSRVARISYLQGAVSLQRGDLDEWDQAVINYPLVTSDSLWTDSQARASEQSAGQSGLAEAQAQVREAQAQIDQDEAAIREAQTNLNFTTIRSPIDGMVVSRNVDVGQTVAASLQTPVLFTIAGGLTRMQVLANIDQADIGVINAASQANFTVDAYPGENFSGPIQQIRLSPQDVDSVVTYNVVIDVANPQLKLKPGMTSNLVITVAERDNVLRVPNAALRFIPTGVTQDRIRTLLVAGNAGGVRTPGRIPRRAQLRRPAPIFRPQRLYCRANHGSSGCSARITSRKPERSRSASPTASTPR